MQTPGGGGVPRGHRAAIAGPNTRPLRTESRRPGRRRRDLDDENVMILGDLSSTKASSTTAQEKLAGYALDEIDRIIKDHGKKIH